MLTVKILGHDCAYSDRVEEITRSAAAYIGVKVDISRICDSEEIKHYSITSTPGLVINEKLVCAGRVPTKGEVTTWLADAEIAATRSLE